MTAESSNGESEIALPVWMDRWTDSMTKAYNAWMRAYNLDLLNTGILPLTHPYVRGCLTTYQTAHIALHVNFIDLQIFVGKKDISGREVSVSDYNMACAALRNWARSKAAKLAVLHCLDLVDSIFGNDCLYDAANDGALHRPWCLYLATITLWAYGYVLDGRCTRFDNINQGHGKTRFEYLHYMVRMRATLDSEDDDGESARSKTSALIELVIESLKDCSWELSEYQLGLFKKLILVLVQEAVTTLSKVLRPGRE